MGLITAKIAFWVSAGWLAYVYVGYPASLWLLAIFGRREFACSEDPLPSVSVLVSARNEAKDIGWKIRDTLNCDYPPEKVELLVASDESNDGTDEVLRSVSDRRFRFIRNSRRQGKNLTLNRLAEMAKGEILFFTDANSHIPAECIRKMTAHFADPAVGCVTGWERTEEVGADPGMSAGGGAYLGYESTINALESALGSVLVCDGSVFCMRKSLFTPVQPDLANDLELPVRIGAHGFAVLYEPQAYSTEKKHIVALGGVQSAAPNLRPGSSRVLAAASRTDGSAGVAIRFTQIDALAGHHTDGDRAVIERNPRLKHSLSNCFSAPGKLLLSRTPRLVLRFRHQEDQPAPCVAILFHVGEF